ncbi:lysozyme-like domain-containing protein [Obelidium mucronatum]|nr:lysozyme-like domain-containing protein [Obelidium mucronatum]
MILIAFSAAIALVSQVACLALKPEWKDGGIQVRDPEFTRDMIDKLIQDRSLQTQSFSQISGSKSDTTSDSKVAPDTSGQTNPEYLSQCQFDIMLHLTAFFENSDQKYEDTFRGCKPTSDDQGISSGVFEFTTCSGSAMQVCQEYQILAQGRTFCDEFIDNGSLLRATVQEERRCDAGKKDAFTPTGLENYCAEWTKAADDKLFRQAQLNVAKRSYYSKITQYIDQFKIKSPLTISQLYDTAIQLGPDSIPTITRNIEANSERDWLIQYLRNRIQYEDNDHFRETIPNRIPPIQRLVDSSVNPSLTDIQAQHNMAFSNDYVELVYDFQGEKVFPFKCQV